MEGIVRQALRDHSKPAVVLVFTMRGDGQSVQDVHAEIGRYYELPTISYRDALWPEVAEGRLSWSDIAVDFWRPNDAGHTWIADLICDYFLCVLGGSVCGRSRLGLLRGPVTPSRYEQTCLVTADDGSWD